MQRSPGSGAILVPEPPAFASIELRITARCCRDDLEVDPAGANLEELAETSTIVRKFVNLRSTVPEGSETFQAAGRADVFTLHGGQQRGATWYDREYRVVWLLGLGTHRSGDRGDSYAYLERLDKRGRLMPTEEDYEALIRERDARQIPEMIAEVRALLKRARADPEKVHSAMLNTGVAISLYVEREEEEAGTIEEFHLAVSLKFLEVKWLSAIRAALWPDDPTRYWEFTKEFPEREEDESELRFRHWHEIAPTPRDDV